MDGIKGPVRKDIGKYIDEVRERARKKDKHIDERERNWDLKHNKKYNVLQRKKQAMVPSLVRASYISENGIDRVDMDAHAKDKSEFNRRVGAQITRGLWKHSQSKNKSIYWPKGKNGKRRD